MCRELELAVPRRPGVPPPRAPLVGSLDHTAICKTLQVPRDMADTDKDQLILGQALRTLRERARLTQGQVGARAGTDDTHVSRMERGQFDIRWRTLRRMLGALDATLADLGDAIDLVED